MKVMISCGEASGDLYAGALAAEIRRLLPDTEMFGLGGTHLQAAGAELLADYHGLAVTGLAEAVRVLGRSYAAYRRLIAAAERRSPDVFVAIDFPDFNLRLSRALGRMKVPILYYVSPQVWAWRASRVETLKEIATEVLVIFPFEEELYRRAGVPVRFVGHPLIDLARPSASQASLMQEFGLIPGVPIIALLPGSRPNEVRRMLPTLAEAAVRIASRLTQVQFIVSRAPGLTLELFEPLARPGLSKVPLIEGRADDVICVADVVITASGTATVQTAIHGKPMVIVYRVSPLTYWLGRRLVYVKTFGMVNLIAGQKIVPELIQGDFTPERVAEEAEHLLTDRARRTEVTADLERVRQQLGSGGASLEAARRVIHVGSSRNFALCRG